MIDIRADIDVTTMSQHDASEYRHELIHAIRNPGLEFDMDSHEGNADHRFYYEKMKQVDAYLATFPDFT